MKFLKSLVVMVICFGAINAEAFSLFSKPKSPSREKVTISTYADFFPFGYNAPNDRKDFDSFSMFDHTLHQALDEEYEILPRTYPTTTEALSDVKIGKIDIFLGVYYGSKAYDGIEVVFPAAINNPVHVMMLPSRIGTIQKPKDLTALKGVYHRQEYFSDFVVQNFAKMNMQAVDTADEAFELLVTGQADYMLGSYYFNYAKVLEAGLKDYISFSKKPLWKMPLFIGVSKNFARTSTLVKQLARILNNPSFQTKVKEDLKEMMKSVEEKYSGVVPPAYIRGESSDELTPADETLSEGQK